MLKLLKLSIPIIYLQNDFTYIFFFCKFSIEKRKAISNCRSPVSTYLLVHCAMGISRSVSMVISYLINTYRLSYFEALNMVQNKRRIANPNEGFVKQLIRYSYYQLGKV